mmetsp:Transcript_17931/g.27745  ORF Transcript_17931/g.27745 Transcript_17931/m.27745 type:complete len:156 (+) Transcript_17931:1937-2404(+)
MLRAQGPIDHPPLDILRCLMHFPLRKDWDVNNEVAEVVKKVGVNAYHFYYKTKKRYIIASRDFVMNILFNIEADGSVYCLVSTDNCSATIPPKSGTIRGDCTVSAFYIQPKKGDPTKSYAYFINEGDLKGSIPEFALRQAQKDQGYQICHLRKVV